MGFKHQLVEDDNFCFAPGKVCSDGSVRWPGKFWLQVILLWSIMIKLNRLGEVVGIFAETFAAITCLATFDGEMHALASAVTSAPDEGILRFGIICQAVAAGFARRYVIEDDFKSYHVSMWRVVNEAAMKARRDRATIMNHLPEDFEDNEVADTGAKHVSGGCSRCGP